MYEIEALINGVDYEVELNAVTGEIVDIDMDGDDDRYDGDDYPASTPYGNSHSHNHHDKDHSVSHVHEDDENDD